MPILPKTSDSIIGTLSATAFVVNESRSRRMDISQDIYAHNWINPQVQELWLELAKNVYPYDDISTSLRCRFYLERLRTFIQQNNNPVFINIAGGFTSYPFLVEGKCEFVEVELPNVIDYKKDHLEKWQREGIFPEKNIHFFATDLNDKTQREQLAKECKIWCANRPSFILMEGITYYLTAETLQELFEIFAACQQSGSLIAFGHWPKCAQDYPVFIRLKDYLTKRFGLLNQQYNLFDLSSIEKINGYEIIEYTDIAAQELIYSQSRSLQDPNNRLPIQFVILKKK